jgi:DNA-binding CsgD family transcriptional regulator
VCARGPNRVQVQRRLEATDIDRLVVDYESGALMRELADRYQISRETVSLHLKRRGVSRRRPGLPSGSLEEVAAAYASGQSLSEIAGRYSVDPSTVWPKLRTTGVPLRARPGWRYTDVLR